MTRKKSGAFSPFKNVHTCKCQYLLHTLDSSANPISTPGTCCEYPPEEGADLLTICPAAAEASATRVLVQTNPGRKTYNTRRELLLITGRRELSTD